MKSATISYEANSFKRLPPPRSWRQQESCRQMPRRPGARHHKVRLRKGSQILQRTHVKSKPRPRAFPAARQGPLSTNACMVVRATSLRFALRQTVKTCRSAARCDVA